MKQPPEPASFNDYKQKQQELHSAKALNKAAAIMQQSKERRLIANEKFLAAWKKGIQKVGVEFFKLKTNIHAINDKWQASPDFEFIEKTILNKSQGHQALLALMYCFYDSVYGQKLLELISTPNLVDARGFLDDEGVEIISELWLHYTGW